jgi:hypothetical protein
LLLSSLLTAGCGTVANLVKVSPEDGGKSPFGGVAQDELCIKKAASGEVSFGAHPVSASHPQVALMLLCAADVPFSFVGDVLTWPYVAAYNFVNGPVPTPPVTLATTDPPRQCPPPTLPTQPSDKPADKSSDKPSDKTSDKPSDKP